MSFADLNLSPAVLKALDKCGYTEPTPIQEKAIPVVLTGKDVIAIAQTGTGKTAAFVLPALELLFNTPKQPLPTILILAPVRELATQITEAIHKYSSQSRIRVVNILGGMPYQAQMRQLSQPHDIIVATPGRLIDYLERGNINLSQIKMFVLDEADRMLDMGFIDDVKIISKHISGKHQTLLFTATMDERITKLARGLLHSPEHIEVAGKTITLEQIKQSVYLADDLQHKNQLLEYLLNADNFYKAIIFSATKHHSDKLAKQLRDQGHNVDALHGDIRQRKRNMILEQFRRGKINILVATDVAARGIDVADVSHVINFDIPRTAEDYVHRIGRTGRAGKEGIAISFILNNENSQLKAIERYIGNLLTQSVVEGLEPKRSLKSSDNKGKKIWSDKNRSRSGQRSGSGSRNVSRSGGHARTGESHHRSDRPRTEGGRSHGEHRGERSRPHHSEAPGERSRPSGAARGERSRPHSESRGERSHHAGHASQERPRSEHHDRGNRTRNHAEGSERPRSGAGRYNTRPGDAAAHPRSHHRSERRDSVSDSPRGANRSHHPRSDFKPRSTATSGEENRGRSRGRQSDENKTASPSENNGRYIIRRRTNDNDSNRTENPSRERSHRGASQSDGGRKEGPRNFSQRRRKPSDRSNTKKRE